MPTFDPNAGTATFVMTANGLVRSDILAAFLREEAARLRTQEPLEVQYA